MKTKVRRSSTNRQGKIITLIVWFLALFVCLPLLFFGNWFVTTFGTGMTPVEITKASANPSGESNLPANDPNSDSDLADAQALESKEAADPSGALNPNDTGPSDTDREGTAHGWTSRNNSNSEGGAAPPNAASLQKRPTNEAQSPEPSDAAITTTEPPTTALALTVDELATVPQLPATPDVRFTDQIASTDQSPTNSVPLSQLPFKQVPTIRTWTSRDGKEATAKLVRVDTITGKVIVENIEGREFRIPLNALSDEDIEYVKANQ